MKRAGLVSGIVIATLAAGASDPVEAGAFTSADNAAFPINLVKHPRGYVGNGGVLTNQVCLINTNIPAGVNVTDVEGSIQKVIDTVNRLRGVSGNLRLVGNNDIPGGQVDYESTLLHEVGHCIGLAHPNLATESGLSGDVRNATKARRGTNGSFDTTIGADGNYGSNDDVRGDDQNVYWWVGSGTNDPLELPDPVEGATLTQSSASADLPSGHTWVANADRDVLTDLGYTNTESVMQQGAFFDEAQRRLTNEDLRPLKFAMTGLDRIEGTADDYTLQLEYGGQVSSASCDINITYGSSFAFCSSGSAAISGTGGLHRRVTSALVSLGETTSWYYSTSANTSTAIDSVSPSPSVGAASTVSVTVNRLSSAMSGNPSGEFEVFFAGDSCIGTLTAGSGSCEVTPVDGGAQTVLAEYLGDQGFDASSTTSNFNVGLATPTVAITGNTPNPSVVGGAYTVSVSVTGGSADPTGNITISDGTDDCTTGNLSGGSASCQLTSTTAGNKVLTATYAGDSNYDGAQDTTNHVVNQATPTVVITDDTPDPSDVNAAYTVAVSVSGAGVMPTGSVTISDGLDSCPITLTGGTGSCELSSTTTGDKTLTANYSGDANYLTASDTEDHSVTQATPAVSITSDTPDPSQLGETYTVEVSVTGAAGTPTGTVTISDGLDECTTGALVGSTASCELTSTTAGAKTLTASYGGDANFSAAQGSTNHQVEQATPVVEVTGSNPAPAIGIPYTVNATVAAVTVDATGNVTISDGVDECSVALSASTASCQLTSTTAGEKTLIATYDGDTNYLSAQGSTNQTVTMGSPTVTITDDGPDPSPLGTAYNVTVTVSGAGVAPSGAVDVTDGSVNCQINLTAGAGSCELTSQNAGDKVLTATYGGDNNYAPGEDTEPHRVTVGGSQTTLISAIPSPSAIGAAYTVEIAVSGAGDTPTGAVTIDDGLDSCVAALAAGAGSCLITSTTAGGKTLTANYPGDANYAASTATLAHTVNPATPVVTIDSSSPNPSTFGEAFAVSVSVSSAVGTPTGTVTISDGDTQCVTPALVSGSASCPLTSSSAGAKTLTATYSGDANFRPNQGTAAHTVARATSEITITGSTPNPSLLNQGYLVTASVTSPVGEPSGAVVVSDGLDSCATSSLVAGLASCVLVSSTAGEKTLTANYAGDANFLAAAADASHTVIDMPQAEEIFSDGFE